MSVEISQRMFSEIMPAFTEVAEMFIMETKNTESAPCFQSNALVVRYQSSTK